MIASPHHSARRGGPVRLVVVHTAEGARTVESLGAWFRRSDTKASSHAGIDDHRIEHYVPYGRAAWTLRRGNSISDNVELCGFARWTRADWIAHPRMLELCAEWIRDRCAARGVPIRKLTPAQVAAGQAGVCGHHDWTIGMKDGTHTDPGQNFPWDHVLRLAEDKAPPPSSSSGIYARYGERNDRVLNLQRFMTRVFASYNRYRPTGFFGLATKSGVEQFQQRTGLAVDGIVGPQTVANLIEHGFTP